MEDSGAGASGQAADLPEQARRRLATDRIAWLATVTADGVPFPTPVWFTLDGDDVVVFVTNRSRKLGNIRRHPLVTLHFETDDAGGDVVVITGEAARLDGVTPATHPGYLDKYTEAMARISGSVEAFSARYCRAVRIRPLRVWAHPD